MFLLWLKSEFELEKGLKKMSSDLEASVKTNFDRRKSKTRVF